MPRTWTSSLLLDLKMMSLGLEAKCLNLVELLLSVPQTHTHLCHNKHYVIHHSSMLRVFSSEWRWFGVFCGIVCQKLAETPGLSLFHVYQCVESLSWCHGCIKKKLLFTPQSSRTHLHTPKILLKYSKDTLEDSAMFIGHTALLHT